MTTLKRLTATSFALLLLLFIVAPLASAQVRAPRPSPKASVMGTIGVTDVTITYSRPAVKSRKIWGDPLPEQASAKGEATLDDQNARPKGAPIVPWGHAWRTGANEATQFVVTDEVLINGQKLPAGSYSLHTIPNKDEFTLIFNSVANQWGSFNYDATKDTLRVKAKPQWVTENKEWLEYSIEPVDESSARVNIRWEKLTVPFTVEVKDVKGLTLTKARAAVAAAKPDDAQIRSQAASYALQNKLAVEEAWGWLNDSIKIRATIGNVGLKARMLAQEGKTAEAIAAGEQAIQLGKDAKASPTAIANLEKLVAEWKSKM